MTSIRVSDGIITESQTVSPTEYGLPASLVQRTTGEIKNYRYIYLYPITTTGNQTYIDNMVVSSLRAYQSGLPTVDVKPSGYTIVYDSYNHPTSIDLWIESDNELANRILTGLRFSFTATYDLVYVNYSTYNVGFINNEVLKPDIRKPIVLLPPILEELDVYESSYGQASYTHASVVIRNPNPYTVKLFGEGSSSSGVYEYWGTIPPGESVYIDSDSDPDFDASIISSATAYLRGYLDEDYKMWFGNEIEEIFSTKTVVLDVNPLPPHNVSWTGTGGLDYQYQINLVNDNQGKVWLQAYKGSYVISLDNPDTSDGSYDWHYQYITISKGDYQDLDDLFDIYINDHDLDETVYLKFITHYGSSEDVILWEANAEG